MIQLYNATLPYESRAKLRKFETICALSHPIFYKTLGRAQDPRANGAWLSKLTE